MPRRGRASAETSAPAGGARLSQEGGRRRVGHAPLHVELVAGLPRSSPGGCRMGVERRAPVRSIAVGDEQRDRPPARAQRLARRRDVRAVPRRPGLGERELAGLLRRLPADDQQAPAPAPPLAPHPPAPPAPPTPPRPEPSPRHAPSRAPAGRRPRRHRGAPRRPAGGGRREGEPLRGAAARIVANMEASLEVPTATSFRERPGQAARGQPPGHQRLPGPHPGRQGQLHPPHRLRRRAGHRRLRAGHELDLRRGRRRQAAGRPPRAREPGPRRRRREVRRQPHPAGAGHPDADTARLPGLLGRLRGPDPQGPVQQAQPRRLRRRHGHAHQPGHDRHGPVGAPAHARPGRDRGRGRHRLPGRVAGRRPGHAGRPRRLQGGHRHLHLRPPHHPGRRVGPVPQAGPGAAARRRRLLRRGLPPAWACPTRRCSGGATSTPSTASRPCSRSRWRWPRSSALYRVRGHLIADLDPLRWKEPQMQPSSTRPPTGSPSGTSTASSSPAAWRPGQRRRSATSSRCCATPTAARSASSTCTSRTSTSSAGSRSRSRASANELDTDDQRHILGRLNAAEAFEKFLGTKYVGQKRFGLEGGERPSRSSTPSSRRRPTTGLDGAVMGMPTGAGSTCSPTSWASPTTRSSRSSRASSTPTACRARAT